MIIRSRAPARIEFGGGGTDYPAFFKNFDGCVLNATINKYIYGTLKPKHNNELRLFASDFKRLNMFENSFESHSDDIEIIKDIINALKIKYGVDIFLRSDVPPNTGLGTSATVATAIIGLFNHLRYEKALDNFKIAELAYNINNLRNEVPGGKQCQYASVFGGFNFIEFKNNYTLVHPLKLKKSTLLELEKNLVLAYVGKRDDVKSIIVNQQISYQDNNKLDILHKLKVNALDMVYALKRNDILSFGEQLGKAWKLKKQLNPAITNPRIDDCYRLALDSGAIGGRIIGAGGGGHMLFYCESNKEQNVVLKLQEMGINVIDFSFTDTGLETWEANQ
ncbi:MAG: GHMP kinase [Nanoarchaeota archaeon]|nr:GHMP kinase [Nanoarchaeota archaeon]